MARLGAFNLDSVQKAQTGQMRKLLMGSPTSALPGQSSTSKDFLKSMVGGIDKPTSNFKKGRKF